MSICSKIIERVCFSKLILGKIDSNKLQKLGLVLFLIQLSEHFDELCQNIKLGIY